MATQRAEIVPRGRAALDGVLATGAGLGAGHLVALLAPASSPVVAVATRAIDLTPGPVKDWAVSTFGTADKAVLVVGAIAVTLGLGALVGLVALRSSPAALIWGAASARTGVRERRRGAHGGRPRQAGVAAAGARCGQCRSRGSPPRAVATREWRLVGGDPADPIAHTLPHGAGGPGPRAESLRDPRFQLLPHRHCTVAPVARRQQLAPVDRGDGGPPLLDRLGIAARHGCHRAAGDARMCVERRGSEPDRVGAVAGRTNVGAADTCGRAVRGGHGDVVVHRQLLSEHTAGGTARRPGRARRVRDERRTAAPGARLPRTAADAGSLRVRGGNEVAGEDGGHHVRREAGVLDGAGLVRPRAHQAELPDR